MTREAVVVEVRGPLSLEGARQLCSRVDGLLQQGAVVCELTGTPDLAVVDALARLTLAAHRRGTRLTITGDDRGLLVLTGLEVLRQAEATEQRGVEEVVDVLDPPP